MNPITMEPIAPALPALTRGQMLWQRMLEYRQSAKLSLARARLLMASYRETEGQTPPLQRARAFEKIVTQIPIFLEDGDLLAGSFSARPMFFEWYPEFTVDQEMDPRGLDQMLADGDREEEMLEIIHYFKDRCLHNSFLSWVDEEDRRIIAESCEKGGWVYRSQNMSVDRGYHAANHERAIQKGFLGVLAEVQEELRNTPIQDEASYRKANFLRGLEIVLKAGIQYAGRYAVLARELAPRVNGQRRKELERLADICDWVPANPARSFYEAVQASCFLHILMHLESRAQESPGRMDQYLYPYYSRDLAAGVLTKEEALEILECFRVKLSTLRLFNTSLLNEVLSGEAQYHNITLGGQTPKGEDGANELSSLFLEAALRTRTPHPTLSIRWHDQLAEDFALQGLELVKRGLGYPAFFNDKSSIPWLLEKGVPLEMARDYCLSGCVQHTIPGQTSPLEAFFFNLPKCLELALYNGVDPLTGKQVGPPTGPFSSFLTFEDLTAAFKKQVKYFSEQGAKIINKQRVARVEIAPTLLCSAFIDDCIQHGKSCLGDGARYVVIGQVGVGMIDVADSLAAIKKGVFEENFTSQTELLEALTANFEGQEGLRKRLLKAPKYGNDDDYVDTIAAELYDWWQQMVSAIDAPYGLKYIPTPYSISLHGAFGKRVGALPNGRLARLPLADGSVSPSPGADARGPTAILNSAGKIHQLPLFGTLLNMKFHPSALKTRDDLKKLLALIKTYFGYGGKHVQFNVVDSKTLREAQSRPELHRNLMVRVAGYSALFTELNRSIQDEIISRTELTMG